MYVLDYTLANSGTHSDVTHHHTDGVIHTRLRNNDDSSLETIFA